MLAFKTLTILRRRILNAAAEASAYNSWSDEYARDKILDAWKLSYKGTTFSDLPMLGWNDLIQLTDDQFDDFGFFIWEKEENKPVIRLIPLWTVNVIAPRTPLVSINGDRIHMHSDLDLDSRGGVIAYGIEVPLRTGT